MGMDVADYVILVVVTKRGPAPPSPTAGVAAFLGLKGNQAAAVAAQADEKLRAASTAQASLAAEKASLVAALEAERAASKSALARVEGELQAKVRILYRRFPHVKMKMPSGLILAWAATNCKRKVQCASVQCERAEQQGACEAPGWALDLADVHLIAPVSTPCAASCHLSLPLGHSAGGCGVGPTHASMAALSL